MKKGLFKELIINLGLDYKKEILKITGIAIVCISLPVINYFFLLKSFVTSIIAFALGGVALYAFLDSYKSKEKAMIAKHNEEFVSLITYFQSYVACNTNVYQAFYHSIQYCSSWMQERLQKLLHQIDNDKSVKPFTDFAECFSLNIANNIMVSIYQMIDQGENLNQFTQFTILFEQMSRIQIDENKHKKQTQLENVTFYPLIGTALLIIGLSSSIIKIAGDMVNVI